MEHDELIGRLRRLEGRLSRIERREGTLRRTASMLTLGAALSVVSMSLTWLGDGVDLDADHVTEAVTWPGLSGWNLLIRFTGTTEGGEAFLTVAVLMLPLLTAAAALTALRSDSPGPSRLAVAVAAVTAGVVGGLYLLGLLTTRYGQVVGSGWLLAAVSAAVVAGAAYAQVSVLRDEEERRPRARTGLAALR
ncbi:MULTISPECIES: hypothetical protein [unclassified Actinotalea]|uniref:hypothetical protein n=1 Tax=unclassified Actinotalea TaxID=2638618 RepID=UPI0015F51904|nr:MULTISPECIES: hypothetical protein [unclassified Actinotalea]